MFPLSSQYTELEPHRGDPPVHPTSRDLQVLTAAGHDDRVTEAPARVRAAIGRRLIAAGAALLGDDPISRPVAHL